MTLDDFKQTYPTINATDGQITINLALADKMIDRLGSFGDVRSEALLLLTAHLLVLDGKAGGSGDAVLAKTSKKVGEVQFSYASETGNRAWYNLSSYGQKLLWLIDMQPQYGGAFVV